MATHRKRPRPPPRTVSRITTLGALGGAGGGDLGAAAEIIAGTARELAASWSATVPGSISVEVHGQVATISADAPPARPNELALRHPLFGNKDHWYGPNDRPFLAPAADAKADAAMARYAKKIDGWARKAGFE
jgi:hypothetical protein